jgi:hypothetical protein
VIEVFIGRAYRHPWRLASGSPTKPTTPIVGPAPILSIRQEIDRRETQGELQGISAGFKPSPRYCL